MIDETGHRVDRRTERHRYSEQGEREVEIPLFPHPLDSSMRKLLHAVKVLDASDNEIKSSLRKQSIEITKIGDLIRDFIASRERTFDKPFVKPSSRIEDCGMEINIDKGLDKIEVIAPAVAESSGAVVETSAESLCLINK